MPKDSKESGIVIINGTAYSAKTGLPIEENEVNKTVTDIQRQDSKSTINLREEKTEEEKTENEKTKEVKNEIPNAKRGVPTNARQLHGIKKAPSEEVLDLRKSARAKMLEQERSKKLKNTEEKKESELDKPIRKAGEGPKLSQQDIRARMARARKHQKSEAIQKFYTSRPENSVAKISISSSPDKAQENNTEPVKTPQIDKDKAPQSNPEPYDKKLNETQQLEKLVQNHPRYQQSAGLTEDRTQHKDDVKKDSKLKNLFRWRPRFTPYAATAASALVLIGFVAYLNMPQMALKVAANRAGFEASMPAYKPSGFSFSGPISYGPGQIIMTFGSNSDDRSFEIVQRKTNWDSISLLENYVETESNDYVPLQQNGLTIYVFDGSNAAWVDGGIWYTIKGESGLSNEQILKVATSL